MAETTVDRKTKKLRFKIRAQAAKHGILALPKEITDDERSRGIEFRIKLVTLGSGSVDKLTEEIQMSIGGVRAKAAHILLARSRIKRAISDYKAASYNRMGDC